jgi:hypothetical protein
MVFLSLPGTLPVSAGNITFKPNANGDPTGGGTDPNWAVQKNGSYEKVVDPLVATYGVDLDADRVAELTVELRTPMASATGLFLSGGGSGGIGLRGNGKSDLNATEILRMRFSSDVIINGFALTAFNGESADYRANGKTWTTTSATVSGLSIALAAGADFDLQLTNPAGSDQFRLQSITVTLPGKSGKSHAAEGIYARLRPLQNKGTKNLNATWFLNAASAYTAQDVLAMIREIKPNVLERYISGPFDPNDVVPVAPGEPPMTIAGFLNASMAAGAPGCIITPRLSLDDLYDTTSCPWSTEFTNCFWATAHNLFNLPVSPPIRTVSLDNWSEFSDSHSAAEIGDVLKKMAAMGWEHIACNYVGGNANSYGIADIGMFGVDVHNGFEPKLSRYGTIITNASIDRVLLYIDFPKQMDGFLQLDPDARANKLLQIGAWQATYDFTFVWPVLQGRWDSTRIFTTPGGPYGGASLYKVMLDAMKHYSKCRPVSTLFSPAR